MGKKREAQPSRTMMSLFLFGFHLSRRLKKYILFLPWHKSHASLSCASPDFEPRPKLVQIPTKFITQAAAPAGVPAAGPRAELLSQYDQEGGCATIPQPGETAQTRLR
ncbi:hypothetical protein BC936DRAFT_148909 [Jimgerdemannia flammicorona]|uniref:Uncharacterized protein n=1 Tax=Jimgerdemannia flammicorona TaxID=994334 RepID=A0A433D210_9FUNG|nr:hypothetical protein BC936DRAFT_148909 [Jimgerdemannia flammicorona]